MNDREIKFDSPPSTEPATQAPTSNDELRTRFSWQQSGAILLADFCAPLLFLWLALALRPLFNPPNPGGGRLLFFLFILLGLAFNRLKRLDPIDSEQEIPVWDRLDLAAQERIIRWLGFGIVGLFVLVQADLNNLIGDTLDLYASAGEVHEGEMSLYIMFGPIFIWFIASAFFVAALVMPTEKQISRESGWYSATEFVVGVMSHITAGVFALYLAGWFSRIGVPLPGALILVPLILVILFFSIRGRHLQRNHHPYHLMGYVVSVMIIGILANFY